MRRELQQFLFEGSVQEAFASEVAAAASEDHPELSRLSFLWVHLDLLARRAAYTGHKARARQLDAARLVLPDLANVLLQLVGYWPLAHDELKAVMTVADVRRELVTETRLLIDNVWRLTEAGRELLDTEATGRTAAEIVRLSHAPAPAHDAHALFVDPASPLDLTLRFDQTLDGRFNLFPDRSVPQNALTRDSLPPVSRLAINTYIDEIEQALLPATKNKVASDEAPPSSPSGKPSKKRQRDITSSGEDESAASGRAPPAKRGRPSAVARPKAGISSAAKGRQSGRTLAEPSQGRASQGKQVQSPTETWPVGAKSTKSTKRKAKGGSAETTVSAAQGTGVAEVRKLGWLSTSALAGTDLALLVVVDADAGDNTRSMFARASDAEMIAARIRTLSYIESQSGKVDSVIIEAPAAADSALYPTAQQIRTSGIHRIRFWIRDGSRRIAGLLVVAYRDTAGVAELLYTSSDSFITSLAYSARMGDLLFANGVYAISAGGLRRWDPVADDFVLVQHATVGAVLQQLGIPRLRVLRPDDRRVDLPTAPQVTSSGRYLPLAAFRTGGWALGGTKSRPRLSLKLPTLLPGPLATWKAAKNETPARHRGQGGIKIQPAPSSSGIASSSPLFVADSDSSLTSLSDSDESAQGAVQVVKSKVVPGRTVKPRPAAIDSDSSLTPVSDLSNADTSDESMSPSIAPTSSPAVAPTPASAALGAVSIGSAARDRLAGFRRRTAGALLSPIPSASPLPPAASRAPPHAASQARSASRITTLPCTASSQPRASVVLASPSPAPATAGATAIPTQAPAVLLSQPQTPSSSSPPVKGKADSAQALYRSPSSSGRTNPTPTSSVGSTSVPFSTPAVNGRRAPAIRTVQPPSAPRVALVPREYVRDAQISLPLAQSDYAFRVHHNVRRKPKEVRTPQDGAIAADVVSGHVERPNVEPRDLAVIDAADSQVVVEQLCARVEQDDACLLVTLSLDLCTTTSTSLTLDDALTLFGSAFVTTRVLEFAALRELLKTRTSLAVPLNTIAVDTVAMVDIAKSTATVSDIPVETIARLLSTKVLTVYGNDEGHWFSAVAVNAAALLNPDPLGPQTQIYTVDSIFDPSSEAVAPRRRNRELCNNLAAALRNLRERADPSLVDKPARIQLHPQTYAPQQPAGSNDCAFYAARAATIFASHPDEAGPLLLEGRSVRPQLYDRVWKAVDPHSIRISLLAELAAVIYPLLENTLLDGSDP